MIRAENEDQTTWAADQTVLHLPEAAKAQRSHGFHPITSGRMQH